ncbi:hypothetical protein C8J57DRAFT_1608084 [Mycena rebaudengoi]|nr:hypothetical protein C8J57DRAFT_1608084 [Mycena rebaudengoi]
MIGTNAHVMVGTSSSTTTSTRIDMPELRELLASILVALAIYNEASKKEAARAGAGAQAKAGLPVVLEATSTPSRTNPEPPTLESLTLKGITHTNCALILDLGDLHLMVQYLTHTSLQIYRRDVWNNTILKVRRFHVGMALVFPEYVFAFLSIDLVFQFEIPPDIYHHHNDFLAHLVVWIQQRLATPSRMQGLARDAVRDANTVFYGIGVYTVMELFFLAGLSPFLTSWEVFSNASRTARLCAAFYAYMERSHRDLWSLLRPCVHDGLLAPTKPQRLKYINWLYIWAKSHTALSDRMVHLVDAFNSKLEELALPPDDILIPASDFDSNDLVLEALPTVDDPRVNDPFPESSSDEPPAVNDMLIPRDELHDLFDVFEPTLVSSALTLDYNLGHLIFGEEAWALYGGRRSSSDDPLTSLFQSLDYSLEVTHLIPEFYEPLLLPNDQIRSKSRMHRDTFAYQGKKQMWSITQQFPDNMTSSLEFGHLNNEVTEIIGAARTKRLFKTIVESTCGVAIGPLEYCGNAHLLHIGNVPVVSVCHGDPTIPPYYAKRSLRGRDRVASNLAKPDKRKRARTDKENQKLTNSLAFLDKIEVVVEEEDMVPAPKKRRISADQRLALAAKANL